MKILMIILQLCFLTVLMPAQTSELDLQKVLAPLANAPFLYFENEYLYFEADQKVPSEMLVGVFHRNGSQEFIRMGTTEVLKSGKLVVATDHEDRVVAARMDTKEPAGSDFFDVEKLAELLTTRLAEVKFISQNGNVRTVEVIDPERPEDKMLIQYDINTWVIKEASITTDDPNANPWENRAKKVTVVVRYLNYSAVAKAFPYKVEQYIRKSGEQYVAHGKCKGYRVL
jgi:hypothetical protein